MITSTLDPYPKLDVNNLSPELYEFLDALPAEYLQFLMHHNGGFLAEGEYSFHTNVPYRSASVNIDNKRDSVIELFGVRTPDTDLIEGDYPDELIRENLHFMQEEVLPSSVLVIGRTAKYGLLVIGNEADLDDYGHVYFYDVHWSHPCSKVFFEERQNTVINKYDDISTILEDIDHPKHTAVQDEYNYATLVKLADNFNDFMEKLFKSEGQL